MAFFSLSVDTDDVAISLRDEGENFADLLNEIVRDGAVSTAFQVEFAAALDEGGREFLKQLAAASLGFDALLESAKEVMAALQEYGPTIVPHLMDSDQNAGQRLRNAIAVAEGT